MVTNENLLVEVWCANAYLDEVPAPLVDTPRCGSVSLGFIEMTDPVLSGYYCQPCADVVSAYLSSDESGTMDTSEALEE